MVWYYVKDGARQGPIEEAEFNNLVHREEIRGNTLVWSEGMAEWKPYSAVAPAPSPAPVTSPAAPETRVPENRVPTTAEMPAQSVVSPATSDVEMPAQQAYTPAASVEAEPATAAVASTGAAVAVPTLYCSQCGRPYPSDELVRFGTATVCANCKDIYAQRLRETGLVAGTRVYAGFWIRFVAVLIDGIALWIVNFAIQTLTFTRITNPADLANLPGMMSRIGVNFMISITLQLIYEAFFLVRFGATPGKMIFKLRVITPDGGGISWGRAIGRYFAKMLSSITLLIGYIMAGFDSEKRALHDYIAGTRVIKTA